MAEPPAIDPLIHAPMRLAIMSALLPVEEIAFTVLRDQVGATDGNLASHLSKLESAGYVRVTKEFVDRKPNTRLSMTERGRAAFGQYVTAIQAFLPS